MPYSSSQQSPSIPRDTEAAVYGYITPNAAYSGNVAQIG